MADQSTDSTKLKPGAYRQNASSILMFDGNSLSIKRVDGTLHPIEFEIGGDYGEADSDVVEASGKKHYNIKTCTKLMDKEFISFGVISEDGTKATMKGMAGMQQYQWMTEEEVQKLDEEESDPIEAPPGEYKIQPENQGKLLWITGAPGLGKSTSAQYLSKTAGYVYYEGDCFFGIRNPYVPSSADNPSLAQAKQKLLRGDGMERRKEISRIGGEMFKTIIMGGQEIDMEVAKDIYGAMCDDIMKERKRIGGDWAVACVTLNRALREYMR